MERGVFDAECAEFGIGPAAATVIDHPNIRLWVESEGACIAYIPASYSHDMIDFWNSAQRSA